MAIVHIAMAFFLVILYIHTPSFSLGDVNFPKNSNNTENYENLNTAKFCVLALAIDNG